MLHELLVCCHWPWVPFTLACVFASRFLNVCKRARHEIPAGINQPSCKVLCRHKDFNAKRPLRPPCKGLDDSQSVQVLKTLQKEKTAEVCTGDTCQEVYVLAFESHIFPATHLSPFLSFAWSSNLGFMKKNKRQSNSQRNAG
jgi:hypothetical protein